MIDSLIGRYKILERIGGGGMGEVFRAWDARLDREVAIKVVSESFEGTEGARRRLEREARAAAKLSHPNIAAIHDVLDVDGRLHIVMELVHGETLDVLSAQRRFSAREVRDIGIQLCEALSAAHDRGVIHRDIKGSNAILQSNGRVRLLDFGLATSGFSGGGEDSTLTLTGQVAGTPAYIAPERLRGAPADERSDLYSLGVLLYRLLTGHTQLSLLDTAEEKLRQILRTTGSEREVEILTDVLVRVLSPLPDQRPRSAAELKSMLVGEHPSDRDTTLLADASPPRPVAVSSRRRFLLAALAILLVVLLASLYVASRIGGRPPLEDRVVAVLTPENASGDASIDHVAVGIAYTLIANLYRAPGVTVVSRSQTLEDVGERRDVVEIARELDVSYVLTGALQRSAGNLRVTLSLLDANGTVVWGQIFEQEEEKLFELQSRIARGVSGALQLDLTGEQQRRLESLPTLDREAYAEYTQARTFMERPDVPGNLELATTLLDRAVERDPAFALAHAALGEAYWQLYEETREPRWTDLAWQAAERARELEADHPAVRYTLARIYHGTGRDEEAVEELQRALALQPSLDEAYLQLGIIYRLRGDLDAALESFDRAIDIRPAYWRHHYAAGHALYAAGRYDEAVEAFQRTTELQPDSARGYQALGTAYHAQGDLDRAVANYQRAIELGPSHASYSNLGTIFYRRGDFEEAVESYLKAIELRPRSAPTHRNLGDAYRRLGRTDEARDQYRHAAELAREELEVDPEDAWTMARLAVYEAKLERFAEARSRVASAVALTPHDGRVLYRKAVVEALAGDSEAALDSLRTALEQGYSDTEAAEDDDLRTLHDMPAFRQLVDSAVDGGSGAEPMTD